MPKTWTVYSLDIGKMIFHTMAKYKLNFSGGVSSSRVPACELDRRCYSIEYELNKAAKTLCVAPELSLCILCLNKIFLYTYFDHKDIEDTLKIWYSEFKDSVESSEQFVRMTLGE